MLLLMKIKEHLLQPLICASILLGSGFSASADIIEESSLGDTSYENIAEISDEIYIEPLFEYIMAPEELPDLQSRTDYLMENFWNPFDFKNTKVVDQNALNHAFEVYSQAMPYASEKKVMAGVKNLISKIKGNPGLTFQFAKAAEENLYGPRAILWADNVYVLFLENLVSNKKLPESKKRRYKDQLALLNATSIGSAMPAFNFVSESQTPLDMKDKEKFALLMFSEPECNDCRYSILKLDISGKVNDLLADNLLDVCFVVLDETGSFDMDSVRLPEKWNVGVSRDAASNLDLRVFPSFYVLDSDKKIVGKNLNVDDAISLLETLKPANKN